MNKADVEYVRNSDGKIESYKIIVYRRDKVPFLTTLTREEVETIFGLYTYYGGNITARNVANEFPKFTLAEIKYIIRAFGITKDSSWAAPHLLEEMSIEQLSQYRLNLKERAAFKYADSTQERDFKNLLNKMALKITHLEDKIETAKSLLNNNEYSIFHPISEKENKGTEFILFLSDLHIGAFNEKYGYIELPDYDEKEIIRRLSKVIAYIKDSDYSHITVCNLGDSVDSYNKQTSRGGHELPSNITNKEQSLLYQRIMTGFFNKLIEITNKSQISYICVGESNHDGDWGWINNVVLCQKLQLLGINTYISNNPIDKFDVKDTSFIFLHGKDNQNQFKGFPLVLNQKTENWFMNYFLDSGLTFKTRKCVVKGDLHQYACTSAKTFDYISAPSLYASSNWITANFGYTKWSVLGIEVTDNNILKQFLIKD